MARIAARILRLALVGAAALLLAAPAAAAPTLELVWSGTSGAGTPGGSSIEAAVGDTLTVDVWLVIDEDGFTGAAWHLLGTGVTAITESSLVYGSGGPAECPMPPHLAAGTCFTSTFKSYSPLDVGVTDTGSDTLDYDLAGITAELEPQSLVVGRGVFVATSATGRVETGFEPYGATYDAAYEPYVPPTSTVTFVPEPASGALVALGLAALAARRRSR